MNGDGFSSELFGIGDSLRKGCTQIADNAGKAIAIITAAIAVLVTFTDVAFFGLGTKEMTASAIVMLISSYLIYFSLVSAGERIGERSDEFLESAKRYSEVREKIKPQDVSALREFCHRYTTDELAYRRGSLLAELGATEDELIKLRQGKIKGLGRQIKLWRIEREKPLRITAQDLLQRRGAERQKEFASASMIKAKSFISELLPTTLCVIFTASIMLTAKENLGFAEILGGAVKLAALPIIGFRGYCTGYFYVRDSLSARFETKTRLLEAFLVEKAESGEKAEISAEVTASEVGL